MLLCAALAAPVGVVAQSGRAGPKSATVAGETREQPIAASDIPSRADADEKFVQTVTRRMRESDAETRLAAELSAHAEAVNRLTDRTDDTDLSLLSVRRLESLERHWRLHARAIEHTRAELARTTNVASEAAHDLARRRGSWLATSELAGLSPALL